MLHNNPSEPKAKANLLAQDMGLQLGGGEVTDYEQGCHLSWIGTHGPRITSPSGLALLDGVPCSLMMGKEQA
jgi:hypothetical protein